MSKSAMIHARLEPELKEEAEAILEKMGLSMTAAMNLFCRLMYSADYTNQFKKDNKLCIKRSHRPPIHHAQLA